MQFLLSKKEYDDLINAKLARAKIANKRMQELCTKICDGFPIISDQPNSVAAPLGCIYTIRRLDNNKNCNNCFVSEICPSSKQYMNKKN